jgi:hypothetical protein
MLGARRAIHVDRVVCAFAPQLATVSLEVANQIARFNAEL